MTLIEIRPIIKAVASRHKMPGYELREMPVGSPPKTDLIVALRRAGLTLREVAAICQCDPSHVGKMAPGGESTGVAASYCPDHNELHPLDRFANHRIKVDGKQPYCREARRIREHKARGSKVRFRRREGDRPRVQVQSRIAAELGDVLHDAALRHRVSKAAFVERAIAKALACTNCRKALREVGGDDCARCREVWSMTG